MMTPLQIALIEKLGVIPASNTVSVPTPVPSLWGQPVTDGVMLMADTLHEREKQRLGLDRPARLRWLAEQHQPYLTYHRVRFNGR